MAQVNIAQVKMAQWKWHR